MLLYPMQCSDVKSEPGTAFVSDAVSGDEERHLPAEEH